MGRPACGTCPFWEDSPMAGFPDRGICHHIVLHGEDNTIRGRAWWCSEHPDLQRDRLAAMAMQGLLASGKADLSNPSVEEDTARRAYMHADAMLVERAKLAEPKSAAPVDPPAEEIDWSAWKGTGTGRALFIDGDLYEIRCEEGGFFKLYWIEPRIDVCETVATGLASIEEAEAAARADWSQIPAGRDEAVASHG